MVNLIIGRLEFDMFEPDKIVSEDGHVWSCEPAGKTIRRETRRETITYYAVALFGDNSDNLVKH